MNETNKTMNEDKTVLIAIIILAIGGLIALIGIFKWFTLVIGLVFWIMVNIDKKLNSHE